jgi:diguanylate cyclase (GGDEF)-like protein
MAGITKLARINVTAWLGRRSRFFRLATSLLLFVLTISFRHLIAPEIHFAVVFLVPISFATWFVAPALGWFFVVAATVVLAFFDFRQQQAVNSATLYLNGLLNLGMFALFTFIFTEVRTLYDREQSLSLHDSLTGLLNRRALVGTLALENRRMHRHHHPLTLAYIDLDDFKHVNDRFGHDVGDRLLRTLADAMKNTVRSTDFVARLGGDEFVVFLPETNQEAAKSAIAKLQEKLLQESRSLDHPVTFSIGTVTFPTPLATAAEMIRAADEAMYAAKQSGKNTVEYRTASNRPSTAVRS